MATSRQIKELINTHQSKDDERFYTVALQIAAGETKKGHKQVANELRNLIQGAIESQKKPRSISTVDTIAKPQGDAANLLNVVHPRHSFSQMVLPVVLKKKLDRIVLEQKQFNLLKSNGLSPKQKILLLGPSGCGKTLTAEALANELGMPLFVVRIDALFTRYLGETANKLPLIFEAIDQNRAVFLFDEFDSIGLERGSHNDIAEMRRVLNSFLVLIEEMNSNSVIIAASNHPEVFDKAIHRRFDDIIYYQAPSKDEIVTLFKNKLSEHKAQSLNWDSIANEANGLNYEEITIITEDILKDVLLEKISALSTKQLLDTIKERKQIEIRP